MSEQIEPSSSSGLSRRGFLKGIGVSTAAAGVITAVNTLLEDEAGKVNAEPMGDGWFFKFKVSDVAELNGLLFRDIDSVHDMSSLLAQL